MSHILKAINQVDKRLVQEVAPITTIKPVNAANPPKPANTAQTQQAVTPIGATANTAATAGRVSGQAVPTPAAGPAAGNPVQSVSFSDTLKNIMNNAGLKSEFERLIAKAK